MTSRHPKNFEAKNRTRFQASEFDPFASQTFSIDGTTGRGSAQQVNTALQNLPTISNGFGDSKAPIAKTTFAHELIPIDQTKKRPPMPYSLENLTVDDDTGDQHETHSTAEFDNSCIGRIRTK